jgi:very-short-patch-repair endonuclease
MKDISKCKSYSEIGRILGYNYYNKHVKQKVIDYCNVNQINLTDLLNNNNIEEKNFCLFCGKELNKQNKKFCNSSCAASFNNKGRKHTKETKEKICLALKKVKKNTYENNSIKEGTCVVCGKKFIIGRTKTGRKSKATTCSSECKKILKSNKQKQIITDLINNGKHKSWTSRNIVSYPEKFWMEVLKNNDILYLHNYHFDKYFLDFFIEINNRKIDLEIDGKQHTYSDRIIKDKERDNFILSNNIEVYRIPWNSINTEKGKIEMKEKIDEFLKFINH